MFPPVMLDDGVTSDVAEVKLLPAPIPKAQYIIKGFLESPPIFYTMRSLCLQNQHNLI
jgi:hypothetical protein